jgi:ABC-type transporter Mla MlaB component
MNNQTLSQAALLQYKALAPLEANQIAEIQRIQLLDVSGFSETEVRSFVIDPIVRVLGYEKGTVFSLDLEKSIRFLDKRRQIDYKCTLWTGNFWIIEAKKPSSRPSFSYDDFSQALEYAVHPEINAALVVLCDGNKLEIFDREVNVIEPVLRIARDDLVAEFDKIRAYLEPWQIWFFEKRRVTRQIDRVFDREFNLERVREFRSLVERQLDSKRVKILDNYRAEKIWDRRKDEFLIRLAKSSTEDIVSGWFFHPLSQSDMDAITQTLLDRCQVSTFRVLYRIFPDEPRDVNDHFYMMALHVLIALSKTTVEAQGLPSWLGGPHGTLEVAVKRLIGLSLTYFEADPPRKIVLLVAASARRILKLLSIVNESLWRTAELQHSFLRYLEPEISWHQITSSADGHVLQQIDSASLMVVLQFIRQCQPEGKDFKVAIAKSRLRGLWETERSLLAKAIHYRDLRNERNLGEIFPAESMAVSWDYIGHASLCVLDRFPEWKAYALSQHRTEIEQIARMGSWQARQWLEWPKPEPNQPTEEEIFPTKEAADRFFFGDREMQSSLMLAYRN